MKYNTVIKKNNLTNYLSQKRLVFPSDIVRVEEIDEYTNVNFVFKVTTKNLFVKQAFDYVKVAPDMPAPIDRQYYEKLSLDWIQRYWKGIVPEVVYYDSQNQILVMTEAGENYKVLASEFDKGKLHLNILPKLAKLSAKLHANTYNTNFMIRPKSANEKHIDFIVNFRLKGAYSFNKKETTELFEESRRVKSSIIYGDFAAKNILVGPRGKIAIVDFQNMARFDPAFDLGYLLAHWYLETDSNKALQAIEKESQAFLTVYKSEFLKIKAISKQELKALLKRAERYIGAIMLHRLIGGAKNPNFMRNKKDKVESLIKIAKEKFQCC